MSERLGLLLLWDITLGCFVYRYVWEGVVSCFGVYGIVNDGQDCDS